MLPEGSSKSSIISQMIQKWIQTDPEAALNWANQSLSGKSKIEALALAGSIISKTDPPRAALLFENIPYGLGRDALLKDIASNWAAVDSKLAIAWLNGLDSVDRNMGIMAMAEGWASSKPLEAAEFGSTLPSEQKLQFLEMVMSQWASEDPISAIAWIKESYELQSLPDSIMRRTYESWALKDPQQASNSIKDFDEKTQALLADTLSSNWARSNPTGAAVFALSLPEGNVKAEAVGGVMAQWSRSDPMEASKWLASLEQGQAKNKGILELALAISGSDPSSAMKWALELSNQEDREECIQRIGKIWINQAGAEAVSEIKKMSLSPSEIKQLGLE